MPSPQLLSLIRRLEEARDHPPARQDGDTAAMIAAYRTETDACLVLDGIAPSIAPDTSVAAVSADGVPCEWVVVPGADPGRRLLWIHGGGWVAGTLDGYRHQVEALSRATGMAVLAVDYRLAPEHPFPAGLDDCLKAWIWLLENGPEGAGAPRVAMLAGDSAGGNLTFALMLRLRDEGRPLPAAAAAFAPATDFEGRSPSRTERAHLDPMLSPDGITFIRALYIQDGTPWNHPYVSPVYGDFTGLPPFLVHAGEREILHDDGLRLVEAARAAGVDAHFRTLPGLVHTTEYWLHVVPEGLESLNAVGAFLNSHG